MSELAVGERVVLRLTTRRNGLVVPVLGGITRPLILVVTLAPTCAVARCIGVRRRLNGTMVV